MLLTGVVGAMYITSTTSFRSGNELSRVQENTRFALHFMQQSIRQAGFSVCSDETKDYNFLLDEFNSTVGGGLVGYEFDGTSTTDAPFQLTYIDLNAGSSDADIAAARASNAGQTTDWVSIPGLPEPLPSLDDIVTRFSPMEGSDIIAVTIEQEQPDSR